MRYNLLKKIKTENGVDIYDSTSVPWNKFEFINEYKRHTITTTEILKPYLISYRYFATTDYEDFILLINGIDDIFEVLPGTEIKVPTLDDINTFLLKYKQ